VLPLVPAVCLVLAVWYARLPLVAFISILVLQAGVNVAQTALLRPPEPDGGRILYHDRPLSGRLASDLAPLTFPTLATIRRSDQAVDRLLSTAGQCSAGPWVLAATGEPVDWRRASYYLPTAVAVRLDPRGLPESASLKGEAEAVGRDPRPIASPCGLIRLQSPADSPLPPQIPPGRTVSGLGIVLGAGHGTLSSQGLTWTVD
jgi:hypothetical protein